MVSVSWGDHLTFGTGDGRLDSSEALRRRMAAWRDELGAGRVHWRVRRTRFPGHHHAAPGHRHSNLTVARDPGWDDLDVVPAVARDAGLATDLYVALFDDGWPLSPETVRKVSYHNAYHARHVCWQSAFSRDNPDAMTLDREGNPQWGVPSLADPYVRAHYRDRFLAFAAGRHVDGIFLCLRSQSRPPEDADQFGFNQTVLNDFEAAHGHPLDERDADDRHRWHVLMGGYLTTFVPELRAALIEKGLRLSIGIPRGDVLGPPLGNAIIDWRHWVTEGLVDELVINQNSSRCPSTWLDLWPMHRGGGYRQDYTTGRGMQSLADQIAEVYAPVLATSATRLVVARQWEDRDQVAEANFMAEAGIDGLIFSSIRHDNPDAVKRNEWAA